MEVLISYFNLPKDKQIYLQTVINELKQLEPAEINIIKSFVNEYTKCDTKTDRQDDNMGPNVKTYIEKIKHLISEDQYKQLLIAGTANIDQNKFINCIVIQFVKQILPIVFKNNKLIAYRCSMVTTLQEARYATYDAVVAAADATAAAAATYAAAAAAAADYADYADYAAYADYAVYTAAAAAADTEDKQKIIDTIVQICLDALKN